MASFENFEPIFGEPKPERPGQGLDLLRRCLFHVYSSDSSHLTVHVTDFVSGSWESVLSVSQLDDMRDIVGVGGSWSEFLDYVVASLKSDNVKLALEGSSVSKGVENVRLVSQKSKGMPRITIPLKQMTDSSASKAMANLSLELFKAFKSMQHLREKVSSSAAASVEKENRDATHRQLEWLSSEKLDMSAPSNTNGQYSPGLSKQTGLEANRIKVAKRVPAHRRARKRGALLQENSEEDAK